MSCGGGAPSGSDPHRFEPETRGCLEDQVVRHRPNVEPERGGGDQAIGVVLALAEGVTDALAGDAKQRSPV